MKKILNKLKNLKFNKKNIFLIVLFFLILYTIFIACTIFFSKQYYSFDGAEGYGAFTDGGRFGKAYHITTLEDSNSEGTLRYAIMQPEPRTIVFDIAGIINLKSPLVINNGNLTIAGQTAPGDGICLRGNTLDINANNVIIRFLRIRPGKTNDDTVGLKINNAKNVIIDHCSISWAKGGNVIIDRVKNLTLQWCFINETMGDFGLLFSGRNENISIHHNMFANNHLSNIEFSRGFINKNIDIRNNLFFNWDTYNIVNPSIGEYNIVKNYYKFGSNTEKNNKNILVSTYNSPKNIKMIYIDGNEVYINPILTQNNIAGIYPNDEFLQKAKNSYTVIKEFSHSPISTHNGEKTKQVVIDYAGASISRDYPDIKILNDIGNSSFLKKDLYTNFCLYPEYKSDYIFVDLDEDGIRDDWELKNKLNPYKIGDALDKNKRRHTFTNRDVYLDSFAKDITKKQYKKTILNLDTLKINFYKIISNLKI